MSMGGGVIAGTRMAGAAPAGIAVALHGDADLDGAAPAAGWAGTIRAHASMSPHNPITGRRRRAVAPIAPTIIATDDRRRACVQ
jgi:hypothetical protein